mgnify:CR=1 FL=1
MIVVIKTYLNHYQSGIGFVRAPITLRGSQIINAEDWQPFTPPVLSVPLRVKQKRRRRGKRRGRRWALMVVGGKLIEAMPIKTEEAPHDGYRANRK